VQTFGSFFKRSEKGALSLFSVSFFFSFPSRMCGHYRFDSSPSCFLVKKRFEVFCGIQVSPPPPHRPPGSCTPAVFVPFPPYLLLLAQKAFGFSPPHYWMVSLTFHRAAF